jgi:hypothetical protein
MFASVNRKCGESHKLSFYSFICVIKRQSALHEVTICAASPPVTRPKPDVVSVPVRFVAVSNPPFRMSVRFVAVSNPPFRMSVRFAAVSNPPFRMSVRFVAVSNPSLRMNFYLNFV